MLVNIVENTVNINENLPKAVTSAIPVELPMTARIRSVT